MGVSVGAIAVFVDTTLGVALGTMDPCVDIGSLVFTTVTASRLARVGETVIARVFVALGNGVFLCAGTNVGIKVGGGVAVGRSVELIVLPRHPKKTIRSPVMPTT